MQKSLRQMLVLKRRGGALGKKSRHNLWAGSRTERHRVIYACRRTRIGKVGAVEVGEKRLMETSGLMGVF